MPGPQPQGARAMTAAEKQARYRARLATLGPAPIVRYRKPADRRPRPQRWHDAVAVLVELQAQYQIWLDGLPPNLEDGATADALREVCGLDLAVLEGLTLPLGFGRD